MSRSQRDSRTVEFLDALTQPQAIIFAGVLGVITALITNLITHTLTWRGQDKRRWDSRRLDAYAEYSRAVKKLTFLALRAAAGRGLPYYIAPLPADEGAAALALAEQDRADHFEAVLLLGGRDVVVAARTWHQCAWHLVEFAAGRFTNAEEWTRAVDANERARAEFYEHARRDLGVRRGELPMASWPPPWAPESNPAPDPSTGVR